MIPILYTPLHVSQGKSAALSNGRGRLPDAISCTVTEERNGPYELAMTYPVTGELFEDIQMGNYIAVIHDDAHDVQPFEIYDVSKPIDGVVTVKARHLSYLLNHIIAKPFTAASAADAMSMLQTQTINRQPFTLWTDKASSGTMTVSHPTAVRELLGGSRGSVLDCFGTGEYLFDWFDVKLYAARGEDRDIWIRYGSNLKDLTEGQSGGTRYDSVVAYWEDPQTGTCVYTPVVTSDARTTARTVPLDMSDAFETAPTVAELTAAAQAKINAAKPWRVKFNYKIDFTQLWQTPEYASVAALQRVYLCDTVHVTAPALGIEDVTAKVIKTVYNVLLERYDSMELGEAKTTLADTINAKNADLMAQIEAELKTMPSKSYIQEAIDHATDLIAGGLGGHVVIGRNADGEPEEILIMDTADPATAVHVIRMNKNGIGFSSTGYQGPFTSAWTIDGHFVADFITSGAINANLITAGTMNADIIRAGLLSDVGGTNWWNLITGDLSLTGDVTMANNGVITRIGQIVFAQYNSTEGRWIDRTAYGLQIVPETGQIHYSITPVGSRRRVSTRKGFDNSDYDDMVDFTASNDSSVRYVHTMRHGQVYEHKIRSASTPTDCARFRFGFENGNYFLQFSNDTSFAVNSSGYISFYRGELYTNGTKVALESTSSKRYKRDIEPLEAEELDPVRLYDLPVVQYRYKDGAPLQYADMAGQLLPGFIAEDVEAVYPAAAIHKDGKVESWDERRIIPGLLALIQDQRAMIEELEARVSHLEAGQPYR